MKIQISKSTRRAGHYDLYVEGFHRSSRPTLRGAVGQANIALKANGYETLPANSGVGVYTQPRANKLMRNPSLTKLGSGWIKAIAVKIDKATGNLHILTEGKAKKAATKKRSNPAATKKRSKGGKATRKRATSKRSKR